MSLAMQITRRARLAGLMGEGIAVLPTSPELARNADTQFPYRFDSSFHYLSGFAEPEAVLVLFAGDLRRSLLFCRNKDVEREIWDGFRYGPDAAREQFGFDEAYPIDELDKMMPTLLENQPKLYATLGADPAWDSRLIGWLNEVRSRARTGVQAPKEILDLRSLVHEMRLFKDESELATMRRAGQISRDAHARAMRFTQPGQFEYQVEAELIHEFYRNGSRFPAYTSIVAGGANACVLHYVENNAQLRDGDLLLIDAGCELHGYAADITRTFPVNGKFSAAQKDVYEIVLAAQYAAIDAAKPGNTWNMPHDAALKVLVQGMLDLKLLEGSVDGVIESESYKQFYMHRTGHWLGMDVHDVGDYKLNGQWRELQPGMVLTVEPGLYLRPAENVPPALANIGIRIEDDVAIVAGGNDILTAGTPKTVAEIEAVMAGQG